MLRWRGLSVINTDGLRIEYSDTGIGVPVVFVPGLTGSKDWFHYQKSGLSDRYRIISYNLRRTRFRTNYNIDLLANDLKSLLNALHISSAVIVGHSFGGLVALKFAMMHPERCAALVLCSTAPSFVDLSEDELLSQMLQGEVKFDNLFDRLRKMLFGSKRGFEDIDSTSGYNADLDRATLKARMKILSTTDLIPTLDNIIVPTLIIVGSGDKPYILSGSQLMYEMIEDSTLEVIEDTDHFVFYNRHDLFNATLVEYLTQKVTRL